MGIRTPSVIPDRAVFEPCNRVTAGGVVISRCFMFVEIDPKAGSVAYMQHPVAQNMVRWEQRIAVFCAKGKVFLNAEIRGPGVQVMLRGH